MDWAASPMADEGPKLASRCYISPIRAGGSEGHYSQQTRLVWPIVFAERSIRQVIG